eukprot:TRINITY_DN5890_c0_g1_i1.p2 TRINITY_DN5890_c0_g1~~TRINITY_DN5890_c0_g1_i1.p2  ORF type:complete len:560 (-),score=55.51 TRINITY_DN5890_c0_g1_i1:10-1689(-)
MIIAELNTESKRAIWERQNGMCAFTGRKFEEFNETMEVEYGVVKPGLNPSEKDNVVMIYKSADLNVIKAANDTYKRYHFPYANFAVYATEEKLSDINEEVNSLVELAKTDKEYKEIRNKIKEASNIINALNLGQDNTRDLSEKLNSALEIVISRQKEEIEKFKAELQQNFDVIKPKVDEAIEKAKSVEIFKEGREALLSVLSEVRNLKLSKESKDDFINAINASLEEINRRQMEERENYEMECIENYHSLKSKVDEAIAFAAASPNFAKGREALIGVQGDIKGKKLKREQREELYQSIRDCFDGLNSRQQEERSSFDSEAENNYLKLKKIVDDAIAVAENVTENFKEARETLIAAQGAIKGMRLRKEQRDELYAAIRKVFEGLNSQQSEERGQFDQECNENYSKLKTKVEETFVDIQNTGDFRLLREALIAVQSEVKASKLKREQRSELFARIREAFEIFDKRKNEYFDKRKQEKSEKLKSIQENLEQKIARLTESIDKDKESLASQQAKLSETTDQARIDQINGILRAIEDRIKEKEEKVEETKNRIVDITKEIDEQK